MLDIVRIIGLIGHVIIRDTAIDMDLDTVAELIMDEALIAIVRIVRRPFDAGTDDDSNSGRLSLLLLRYTQRYGYRL